MSVSVTFDRARQSSPVMSRSRGRISTQVARRSMNMQQQGCTRHCPPSARQIMPFIIHRLHAIGNGHSCNGRLRDLNKTSIRVGGGHIL